MLKRAGLIGTGRMGAGMGVSLLREGFEVVSLAHRSPLPDRLREAGCVEADSIDSLVDAVDILILCLPSSAEVRQVLDHLGPERRPSSGIVLDCSTSLPSDIVSLAGELSRWDIRLYDSPLTRSPREAEEGRLRCITSCDGDDWTLAAPMFEAFCEDVIRVQGVGKAGELKLVNNLLSMGQVCVVVDALRVAHAYGVQHSSLQDVVRGGAADSPALAGMIQYLRGDHGVLNFSIEAALKDVRYALSHVDLEDQTLAVARAVEATFARAVELGRGSESLPALLEIAGIPGS